MDLSQIMGLLPTLIAVLTPMIVQAIKGIAGQFMGKIPKAFIPVIAAIVGAVAEALTTGTVTQMGPGMGLAATGLRDMVKNVKPRDMVKNVKPN